MRSVEVERRATLRFMPNDPALSAPETAPGTPSGTTVAWWVPRIGPARRVGHRPRRRRDAWPSSTPASTAGSPTCRARSPTAIDTDDTNGHGPPTSDENGHGTHVASLACAAGDNGFGSVGSGLNCRLLIVKSDLSDGSIARSIVQAADRGADAINMSFGSDEGGAPQPVSDAIEYAYSKGVVLVAAADDRPVEEQGYPVQPAAADAAAARDLAAGRGLTVTAANFAGQRASFAGRGSQISLAAPGALRGRRRPGGHLRGLPRQPDGARGRRQPARARLELPLPRDLRRRLALRLPAGNVDGGADRRRASRRWRAS